MLHMRSISFLWQVVTPYKPLMVAIMVCHLFSAEPLFEPILGHMPHNSIWLSQQRWRICMGCHNKVWCQVRREINGMICLNTLNETLNDGQVANSLTSFSAKHIILVSVAINGDEMSVSNLIIVFCHFHRSNIISTHFSQLLIWCNGISWEGFIKTYGLILLTGAS